MNEQIEEMAIDNLVAFLWLKTNMCDEDLIFDVAEALVNAGYRKQIDGEWEQSGLSNPKCSLCRTYNYEKSNYCPNCGAHMKGGES